LRNNLDFGFIGNCRSGALISSNGSMDWCCLPQFDSPSVFAKLLDPEIGGSFGFDLEEGFKVDQYYLDNTVVLVTVFFQRRRCL
jgi:GH15 family glucan-1,4-alpha-glucosidase